MDQLQYRGLLRIARRENGIRVYEVAPPAIGPKPPLERLRKLILIVVNVLAPVQERTLQANIARYRYLGNTRRILEDLFRTGELERDAADGLTYVWPAARSVPQDRLGVVRFMAPFGPLVWDRRRFEHFWEWPYRFEAYTPPARRIRGYYAMPLLWRDRMIGWANARVASGRLNVHIGFVDKCPGEADFRSQLDAEIARMEAFL